MKRYLIVILLVFCLLPLISLAETEPEPLFPAKGENGKWGYINRQGEFVIEPKFDLTTEFRGNYAVVTVYPEGFNPSEGMLWTGTDCEGIIDHSGNFVVEPTYSFDSGYDGFYFGGKDTGIWCVNRWRDDSKDEGWFDIQSGYFSGLTWCGVYPWVSDSKLIPVLDETFLGGYADRTTGELAIPCQYYYLDPSNFIGGVASVAFEDEEGNPLDFFLIDETGAEIPLPEGIHGVQYEGALDGRVMVINDEELFGFVDVEGNLIIEPQFIYANSFEDGFAVVQYPEGDWACIDPDGNVLVRGLQADHWSGPDFENGMYTCQTGQNEFSVINLQGETVMAFTYDNLVKLYSPDEDGLCLFATDPSGKDYYWTDRKFGYVDLTGQVVAEPVKDGDLGGSEYENGLAYFNNGFRCGYIDEEGNEVYSWEVGEDGR